MMSAENCHLTPELLEAFMAHGADISGIDMDKEKFTPEIIKVLAENVNHIKAQEIKSSNLKEILSENSIYPADQKQAESWLYEATRIPGVDGWQQREAGAMQYYRNNFGELADDVIYDIKNRAIKDKVKENKKNLDDGRSMEL